MAFKIGFTAADTPERKPAEATYTAQQAQAAPRKSVVQVYFAGRNMTLAYYNDQFDLHRGDIVYVDGKLFGRFEKRNAIETVCLALPIVFLIVMLSPFSIRRTAWHGFRRCWNWETGFRSASTQTGAGGKKYCRK